MGKKHHEEHVNTEAWAIPYGDLVTLLLAFFVVMYAVSSVNEGKYRVLADAMAEAFGGPPKSIKPIQLGQEQMRGSNMDQRMAVGDKNSAWPVAGRMVRDYPNALEIAKRVEEILDKARPKKGQQGGYLMAERKLSKIAEKVEKALTKMIDQDLVSVRRSSLMLEIEIRADVLFSSGSALLGEEAQNTLKLLAGIFAETDNLLRIEGHTDDVKINTSQFASNWELSAARSASVVHIFSRNGIHDDRMAVVGYGEYQPRAANDTPEGRNLNRRVVIVILADPKQIADRSRLPFDIPGSLARN